MPGTIKFVCNDDLTGAEALVKLYNLLNAGEITMKDIVGARAIIMYSDCDSTESVDDDDCNMCEECCCGVSGEKYCNEIPEDAPVECDRKSFTVYYNVNFGEAPSGISISHQSTTIDEAISGLMQIKRGCIPA